MRFASVITDCGVYIQPCSLSAGVRPTHTKQILNKCNGLTSFYRKEKQPY